MPELPEVETIARQLDTALSGKTFASVSVLREKSFRGEESVVGPDALEGMSITGVERFAKYIQISLSEQDLVILVHLKMTGQMVYQQSEATNKEQDRVVGGHPSKDWVNELPSSHTRIVASFSDGSTLYFNDMRVFGWWKVVSLKTAQEKKQSLPPDVIDAEFTPEFLYSQLQRSSRAVKLVILDQSYMGGMGNIYANDALFLAKIYPKREAKRIRKEESDTLHEAMVAVLKKGIETGGATYSDFVDSSGMGGTYQEHFLVYDREDEPCLACGTPIEKLKVGGRGTYFCPTCQK